MGHEQDDHMTYSSVNRVTKIINADQGKDVKIKTKGSKCRANLHCRCIQPLKRQEENA